MVEYASMLTRAERRRSARKPKNSVVVPEVRLPCGCVIRGQDDTRPGERWYTGRGVWRSPDCQKNHLTSRCDSLGRPEIIF